MCRKVLLVEAGADGERCGASRWTGAYLRLDKDLKFDKAWKSYVNKTNRGLADLKYCDKLGEIAGAVAEYVESKGVELIRHKEEQVALEFDTGGYFVRPNGGGLAIINKLLESIRTHPNCTIAWETAAERLVTNDEGDVVGAVLRGSNGKLRTVSAPHVMLACGGFEGNVEMLTQYVGKDACDLPIIAPGLKYNQGAGIRMAKAVGAATSGTFHSVI